MAKRIIYIKSYSSENPIPVKTETVKYTKLYLKGYTITGLPISNGFSNYPVLGLSLENFNPTTISNANSNCFPIQVDSTNTVKWYNSPILIAENGILYGSSNIFLLNGVENADPVSFSECHLWFCYE